MLKIFQFFILGSIHVLSRIFFKIDVKPINSDLNDWSKIKILAILNHTSLFEPLFLGAAPLGFIWKISGNMIAPGADSTLRRPVVGRIYKLMFPQLVSITRKRDESWNKFMDEVHQDTVVIIAPEGRMARKGGLDKYGKPMTVRGGISDILEGFDEGDMLLAYSGGLHHVQFPGQFWVRPFQKIKLGIEILDIKSYKKNLFDLDSRRMKRKIIDDLQDRLIKNKPKRD